jgi:hypothetical protein
VALNLIHSGTSSQPPPSVAVPAPAVGRPRRPGRTAADHTTAEQNDGRDGRGARQSITSCSKIYKYTHGRAGGYMGGGRAVSGCGKSVPGVTSPRAGGAAVVRERQEGERNRPAGARQEI